MTDTSGAEDDDRLISDDELPEDLQPKENPLAQDPDDDDTDGSAGPQGSEGAGAPGGATDGMPDAGN